ncbi:MAG: hypothetical protein ACLFQJ_09640 [Campylobacterales bacterium]
MLKGVIIEELDQKAQDRKNKKITRVLYINTTFATTLLGSIFIYDLDCCLNYFLPLLYYVAVSLILLGFYMMATKIYYRNIVLFIINRPITGGYAVLQGFIAVVAGFLIIWFFSTGGGRI